MSEQSERKLVTVLFADLADSTALADDQDPERTRARLARFYDAMKGEIEAAGGTVEKFAGDAVMAAFGAPEALEDHAERALHAALSMQRKVESGLALRIGVNTGEVVVGAPREASSFVSGDAVNVAARLEQAAQPGEILAGERTVAAARGAFEFGEPRSVEAKGKSLDVRCRGVVRALSLMRTRGVGGLARVFVGREAELERLRAAYHRAVRLQAPVLVTVLGDAGVGKTRLVRELWEQLGEEQPEPVRRTGRCLAYGQAITYWPLAEILKEHLGILESDSPAEVRRRLGDREILGLTLGLDLALDLHPLAARDRHQAAWVAFLSELAGDRPVVVLVEDVHWAEPPLLELIERLAQEVRGPLLVITTARPDFFDGRTAWDSRIDTETVWLEPLPSQAAASLVDGLLEFDLPAAVRELIVERAEGNPFFVEEVLGSLIDAGVLERRDGRWRTGELPADFEIPDSIQAVLAARIDLLGESEKAALQAAAVIGRVFWTGPIYELVAGLEPDLRVLESRDLIRRRSSSSLEGEVEYVFKHALTREVAYGSLTKPRRARLHAGFAAWILRLGGGRDEHAPLLAHHFAEAVRPEDADLAWQDAAEELERFRAHAVTWLERAADLAVSRYELDDALALLQRAVDLEPDALRESELWRKIGLAHALKFEGEEFWTAMQRSLAVCVDREKCANSYADLSLQTAIRSGMWRRRPDPELVSGWIEQALALAAPESEARAKALIARCFWSRKDVQAAADEASALAERLGNRELRSHALGARAITAFADGKYAESARHAERRLEVVGELSDPDHIADVYEIAIPAYCVVGRFAEARRLAEVHDELVEPLSTHHRVHGIAVVLEVEELAGAWDQIAALGERTQAIVEDNVSTPCIRNARALLLTALAAAHRGDTDAADHYERRAHEVMTEGYEAVVAAPLAQLALVRGKVEEALAIVPPFDEYELQTWFALPIAATRMDALAAARDRARLEREAPLLLRRGMYMEPFALRALGVVREDAELLARAVERFSALSLDWHAEQTRALL
ncbi:MAG TPA: adenylate/guanylate cyclase domain-containing protein [Gaiellaceae bacterium]|nr:adenylate/guanylate cyclase domain-containing protein [Gaiellaceae bacterium]